MNAACRGSLKISKGQIKIIYTLAQGLGLVDKMAGVDELHELVYGITRKEHTSDLTSLEANQVIERLKGNMRGFKKIENPQPRAANMATEGEKKKIWALMYELKKYDTMTQSPALAKRLIGFLKKYAGIDAHIKDPFKFLTHDKANSTIEGLKGLIASEKKRAQKCYKLTHEAGEIAKAMETAGNSRWAELNERLKLIQKELDMLQYVKE